MTATFFTQKNEKIVEKFESPNQRDGWKIIKQILETEYSAIEIEKVQCYGVTKTVEEILHNS